MTAPSPPPERLPSVLHVSETTDGGVGTVLRQLLAAEQAAGWQVTVAAPHEPALAGEVEAAGGRWVDWRPGARPGPDWPSRLRQLSRLVSELDPGLLHLHTSMAGLSGRWVVRGRRPTLLQPHGWSFYAVTGPARTVALAWERFGARWASAVLCVSDDERRAAAGAGVRGDIRVVVNGVALEPPPVDEAGRRSARAALLAPLVDPALEAPLAVCVGRLHRQKGQHALLDAWPAVRSALPTARLALVGDGPDRADLVARAVPGVEVVGPSREVRRWLDAADVAVMPSRWEGLSLSLLEAMAAARSVVVTDVPGMREVVGGPGEAVGALVPGDEPAALVAALVARLSDPRLAAREGQAGRRRVVARHDLAEQTRQVLELSRALASGSAPVAAGRT